MPLPQEKLQSPFGLTDQKEDSFLRSRNGSEYKIWKSKLDLSWCPQRQCRWGKERGRQGEDGGGGMGIREEMMKKKKEGEGREGGRRKTEG